jgi:hypothetical protein
MKTMFGSEWFLILAFVAGLVVGCAGTAWCVRFGLRAGYAVKHNEPILPTAKPEEDDIEAELKMLKERDGKV